HSHDGTRSGDGEGHGGGHGMNPAVAIPLAIPLYLWNFAPHPFKPGPGEPAIKWAMDVPMWFGLLILEFIGAGIKPCALMIRLFANMIAGHIVLAALIFLIPVTASVAAQIGIGAPVTALSLM